MRPLLLLPVLLVSCAGPSRTVIVDGSTSMTVEETGSLGGKTFSHVTKSKLGALSITKRNDMEASFQAGVTAGVGAFTAYQYGLTQRASDAASAGVAIGAQKAATKQAGIAAGVETERIRAAAIPQP